MTDKNGKPLRGTAKYLHQVYTEEGGPENHDSIQQDVGALGLAAILLAGRIVKVISRKAVRFSIKVIESMKEGDK